MPVDKAKVSLGSAPFLLVCTALLAGLVARWETSSNASLVVIFFGRPSDMLHYISSHGIALTAAGLRCAIVALVSLLLAMIAATLLLILGLLSSRGLDLIERIAAVTQTVPMLVIVVIVLLLEEQVFHILGLQPTAMYFCIVPVAVALVFPPLANGVGAVHRVSGSLKSMLRLWGAPRMWSFRHVLLPLIVPDVMTGARASATWAVGATLITEGLLNGVNGDAATLGRVLAKPFSGVRPGETPAVVLISIGLGYVIYMIFITVQSKVEERFFGKAMSAEKSLALFENFEGQ